MHARIFVTGGTGYIGSHVCKALAGIGCTPVVYDNLMRGHADAVKWGPLEIGDIRDRTRLNDVMRKHEVRAVMRFASLAYVGGSMTSPSEYYDNNVYGSFCILDTMRKLELRELVFSSSCATYGTLSVLPISEDTPQVPINLYGFTKFVVERMILDFSRAYGLRALILRYFNAAGADPEGELGERHEPETHAIPLAIRSALNGDKEFEILGNDYNTPDGTAIRDYIHVCDLADAHVKAVMHLSNGRNGAILNLATGPGVSVKELIAAVESATGRSVSAYIAPRRAGDPPALFADGHKAYNTLGWRPRFTDIESIVKTAVGQFQVMP